MNARLDIETRQTMTAPESSLSRMFSDAVAAIRNGERSAAERALAGIQARRAASTEPMRDAERRLLAALHARCAKLPRIQPQTPAVSNLGRVGSGEASPLPGVSVVSCCMNRTENLLKALPTWLAHERVDEIIIVDWSSREPVATSLAAAGIDDPRIRIARVVDEPRWILSFAFNLGFRLARHEAILKLDADITLKPDFFDLNPLPERSFVAGNWEVADKGQEHINGFFYVRLSDLLRVKGFNEYITTYGWDDDDIYGRLQQSGLTRVCVDTKSIYHIPHDDAQRLGSMQQQPGNALEQLHNDTLFKIRTNRFLATMMPPWNKDRQFAPFDLLGADRRSVTMRRVLAELPHVVSDDIRRDAESYAATEIVSWRLGPEAYHVPKRRLMALLKAKRLEQLCAFDLALAADEAIPLSALKPRNVVIELAVSRPDDSLRSLMQKLTDALDPARVAVFVTGASAEIRRSAVESTSDRAIVLDAWKPTKGLAAIDAEQLPRLIDDEGDAPGWLLRVDDRMLETARSWQGNAAPVRPVRRRRRLYLDAQHGLGNRLRAFASAAAVARRTDRELILLWAPDHHCECRFADLFDANMPVIESAEDLPRSGLRRYSYMELEPGARKDEPIDLETDDDVLVRSAYVLKHPASQWNDENTELRALRPTREVADLVARVSVDGCIGAHVRMEAGKGLDRNSYDSNANWSQESHDQIQFWRDKSHYSAFIRRIDALFAEQPSRRLFLATDLPENYEVFRRQYGERMCYLPRQVYDRSREQIIYALADAILLSRCEMLLGSTWSSFSELAMRLSTTYSHIEMSGKDF
jgi:hypothetical protein